MALQHIYRVALDSMHQQVYVCDPDMNVVYFNPAAEKLTGWSLEQGRGKKCHEIFGGDHVACKSVCPVDKAISERLPVVYYEGALKTRLGDVRKMKVSVSPMYERETAVGAVVVMEDITGSGDVETADVEPVLALENEVGNRSEAEQAPEDRDRFLSDVFLNFQDGIRVLDKDLNIIRVNRAIGRRYGHEMSVTGKKCYEVYEHRTTPCEECGAIRAIETGKVESAISPFLKTGEEPLGWLDVSWFPVRDEVTGETRAVIQYDRDISERIKFEDALRKSETRYRALFKNMGNAVAVYRAENAGRDFILVDFNAAAEKIDGISRDRVVGKSVLDTFPGITEFGLFDVLQRVWRTGEPEHHPVALYEDERIEGWRENFVYRLPTGEIVSIYSDETERKQAEAAVRTSEAQLSNALTMAHLGHWEYDVIKDLFTFNDHFYKIFHTTAEQVGGYTMSSADYARRFVHPDDFSVVAEETRHAIETTDPHYSRMLEHRILYADGEIGYMSVRFVIVKDHLGRTVRTYGVNQDITELRRAEEAQRLLATAVDQAAEAVLITDSARKIQYVNPALERITGFPKEELIGKTPRVFLGDEHEAAFYNRLWETVKEGKPWSGRLENRRKDGSLLHEEATLSPVRSASGEITNFVVVAHDITDQLELSKQLFQAQKMEAVGTLAGGIAHDFNNLLQIIAGHAEFLEMELAERGMRFGEVDAIRQGADRGAELVRQILTFSRKVDTKFDSINLNEDVKDTERLLYRTIPKMVDIKLRLEDRLRPVRADSSQIEQVLINLALNAKDAMPDGGKLLIETGNVILDEEYCRVNTDCKPGPYVRLRVSDTGCGIEPEVLGHIFEPFFTTKGLADGMGLGLSTVFGIVKMHGGHIVCESEIDKGTTFDIFLPVADAHVPAVAKKPERQTVVAGRGETILVVDDEPLVTELAQRILERAGYSVISAGTGAEAIALYSQHRSDISLVILDLNMPKLGGKECLEELLKIDPQVKTLIASGFTVTGDTKAFLDSEAQGIVSKPFKMRELLRAVRHIVDGV